MRLGLTSEHMIGMATNQVGYELTHPRRRGGGDAEGAETPRRARRKAAGAPLGPPADHAHLLTQSVLQGGPLGTRHRRTDGSAYSCLRFRYNGAPMRTALGAIVAAAAMVSVSASNP